LTPNLADLLGLFHRVFPPYKINPFNIAQIMHVCECNQDGRTEKIIFILNAA